MHLLPLVLAALLTVAMPPPSSAAILEILVNTDKQLAVLAVKRLYSKRVPSSAVNGHLPPDDEGDVVFEFDNGEVSRCQLLREPATIHAEDFHDHGEIHEAETGEASHMLCAGYANDTARSVAVRQGSKRLRYTLTEGHTFHSLQSDSLVHKTMQYVGPVESQTNLIFLSAGYLADQSDAFFSDVSKAMNLLQFPTSDSIPLSRYFSASNVFAVFQASVDQGASNPQRGVTKNNNLQCSYGETSERLLTCDVATCFALAATAPVVAGAKNNIVVTLVDDTTYGGAAVFNSVIHITWFYNAALRDSNQRATAGSLMFHELGHAQAQLIDEYSLGITGTTGQSFPNCHWKTTTIPWQEWIDSGHVLATPSAVCGYTNYFKPTDTCMMKALDNPGMCAVCREASVTSLYTIGMDISQPVCPHQDHIVNLSPTTSATFYLNNKVLSKGGFSVKWYLDNVEVTGQSGSFYTLQGSVFGTGFGNHRVNATISDDTDWVKASKRTNSFTVSVSWVVLFVNGAPASSVPSHDCATFGTILNLQAGQTTYRATCGNTTGNCSLPQLFTSKQEAFTKELDINTIMSDNIFGTGGLIVLACAFVGFCLWFAIARRYAARPLFIRELVNASGVKQQRWFLIGYASFWFLASILGLAFAIGLYGGLGTIMRDVTTGLIAFAGTSAVVAFTVFSAAFFVSPTPLFISTALTVVLYLASLVGCVITIVVGFTVTDDGAWAAEELRTIWQDAAESEAGQICRLQSFFECSGWEISCSRLANQWCPTGCEQTNALYASPCKPLVSDFLEKHLLIIGWIGLALTFVLIGVMFCARSIALFLKAVEATYEGQKDECKQLLKELSPRGRKKIIDDFRHMDKRQAGMVSKAEFFQWYPQTTGYEPTATELERIWSEASSNQTLSFVGFVRYFAKTHIAAETIPELDTASSAYPGASAALQSMAYKLQYQMAVSYQMLTAKGNDRAAFAQYYRQRAAEDEAYGQFARMDADSDGVLSWTEFVNAYESWKGWLSSVVEKAAAARLTRLYLRYNPQKLAQVGDIIGKYSGKYAEMFRELEKRYGPEPMSDERVPFEQQRRLERFYQKYGMRNELTDVDAVLMSSPDIDALFAQLVKDHGPEPIDEATDARLRLTRFYERYCPEKLPGGVAEEMGRWDGRYAEMLAHAESRLGPEPSSLMRREDQARLERYYRHHGMAGKLATVDKDLEMHQGQFDAFMAKLVAEHGPEPPTPAARSPPTEPSPTPPTPVKDVVDIDHRTPPRSPTATSSRKSPGRPTSPSARTAAASRGKTPPSASAPAKGPRSPPAATSAKSKSSFRGGVPLKASPSREPK